MSLLNSPKLIRQSSKKAIPIALDITETDAQPRDLRFDGYILGSDGVEVGSEGG